MSKPETTWVIDCGHWHCVDRNEQRHAHDTTPETCVECAEERPVSERAAELEARALRIAEKKRSKT